MSVNILEDTILLPSAYQQVEYIESTGTQWIDTGIKLENNSYCNIDFKYSELQYQLMGGNSETTQRYFIGIKSTLDLFYFGTGDTNNYYYTADTNRHSFIIDMPNSKIAVDDNYSNVSFTFTNNNSSHNFYLFARINSAGEIVNNCSGRLYRALFKHNNEVIREFIPCYRKSDNEIGLYDLVNDEFYINSGSGTFTKGNDTPHTIKRVKPYLIKSNSQLPDGYTEVTYLQGSGTQYIDTGIKLSHNDTIKCKFEVMSTPSSYAEGIYGTMEYINGTNTFFVLLMRSPNLARVGTSSNQVTSTNIELSKIYDTELSNGTYIENGTTYTFTPSTGFSFNTNCYLFKRNQSSMTPISARVYSFEIVGRFKGIPCYRNSDNVAGIYDTVSQTFFTNTGTGTFSVGAKLDIPMEYQKVEYIQLDSTDPQTTGILLNTNYTEVSEIRLKYEMLNEVSSLGHPMILCAHTSGSFSSTTPYVCADSNASGNLFNTNYTDRDDINNPQEFIINARSANSGLIKIGGWNDIYWTAVGRYYYVTLYNSNLVPIVNLIPCYRKADSVIGMYDNINNIFYANGGTGTFTKGANISSLSIQPVKINILSNKSNNLLNINRREWNNETKNPTDLVTFDYNKLYYMASSGYIRNASIADLSTNPSTGSVSFTQGSSSWWGVGYPIEVKPNTKYTISGSRNDGNITKLLYCLYNSDGSFSSYAQVTTNTSILDMSLTITTGANTKTMCIVVAGITNNTNVSISNLQVEEGQTQTSFKHYGYDIIKI